MKTLKKYREELEVLEEEYYYQYSGVFGTPPPDDEELKEMQKAGRPLEVKITKKRKNCIKAYGEIALNDIWWRPGHEYHYTVRQVVARMLDS